MTDVMAPQRDLHQNWTQQYNLLRNSALDSGRESRHSGPNHNYRPSTAYSRTSSTSIKRKAVPSSASLVDSRPPSIQSNPFRPGYRAPELSPRSSVRSATSRQSHLSQSKPPLSSANRRSVPRQSIFREELGDSLYSQPPEPSVRSIRDSVPLSVPTPRHFKDSSWTAETLLSSHREPTQQLKPRRKSISIAQRYPGDMSDRPLAQIKKEHKTASKAAHLRTKSIPITDTIDSLDDSAVGGAYHHGGPYDATLAARNVDKHRSPVEAVKETNQEALRATPREYIENSLKMHVPLQGVAIIPPGETSRTGEVMHYEEGTDLMRERNAGGGAYKRWDHVAYRDEDLKGKGEPGFTYERDLKARTAANRSDAVRGDGHAYEMQPRSPISANQGHASGRLRSASSVSASGAQGRMRSSSGTSQKLGEGLKRRFGSLRHKNTVEA